MRSHLLVLLIFSIEPIYSYNRLNLPGFDIRNNRVIGNGWNIQENRIKRPDGFSWQPNPMNPTTPPSLPPPFNEIDLSKFRRAPTLAGIPNEPPILQLRGFDLWKNRVIGNGWDIQENMIKGPGGFYWQKNKATDTPPSLPPPLNEIVWCTGCFLGKAYGRPTWSVDMSRFRREPTLMEPPSNINDFQNKQAISIPVSHQQYLQFPWQKQYMAPQPPFFRPGMLPSQYNGIPPFFMPQFPYQSMPNSNFFMFNRPPYGMPFPPPNDIAFINTNEPNPDQELSSEEDEDLLSSEEMAPLPKDEDKMSTPYPDTVPFPNYELILPGEQINLQKNEAKLPSEGQTPKIELVESEKGHNTPLSDMSKLPLKKETQSPKTSPLNLPPKKIDLPEFGEGHNSPLSDMSELPLKEETQSPKTSPPNRPPKKIELPEFGEGHNTSLSDMGKLPLKEKTQSPKTSPPNRPPKKIELPEFGEAHNTPLRDMGKLPTKEETQLPKNDDNLLTSPPNLTPPPKIELAESEKGHSPTSDMRKLLPKEETQLPKNENNLLTSPPNLTQPPKIELAESEDPLNGMSKLPPKEETQLPKNDNTLLTSSTNLAQGSTRKNVPSSRAKTNWRNLASKALQANRTSRRSPAMNDQEVPTKRLDSNEVLDKVIPDTTDNSPNVKQDSPVGENTEDNNILDPIFDFVSTLFSSKPSDHAEPTPLDFQNSMRDPDLARGNGSKNKKTPLEGEENVDKNTHVKNDSPPAIGQPENYISKNDDQTEPKIQQHPPKEIDSNVEDKKEKENSSNTKLDSSTGENIEEDNNILDPIIDFVSSLFSSNPFNHAEPTPLDFQNSMRDPDLAAGNGSKNKKTPLKNVDKNTHVKNDLPSAVGQPENNISTTDDKTEPKVQQHPQKEIGSDNEDKKQNGNTIINEDKDDTQTPENKEIKEEKPEVNEKIPQNEDSKEEKPETHEEQIPENKEHKPEVQDESKEFKEEKPENKESPIETPENHDEQVPESKEQKPDVQDESKELKDEKPENKESPIETPENHDEQVPESKEDKEEDQGRHGIERPGVDFVKNSGTIQRDNKKLLINGTKYSLLIAPGKVVLAKEYNNTDNQPIREVYLNGNMIEKYINKKKVLTGRRSTTKTESKADCDGIQGQFEDTIDFTKKFHRVYNDDLCLLSEVTPATVHLQTLYKETGNLYEEKYTLGVDGKLIFQKINDAVICGEL